MQIVTAGWAIAISLQVAAGLGQHVSALTSEQLMRYQQVSELSSLLSSLRALS